MKKGSGIQGAVLPVPCSPKPLLKFQNCHFPGLQCLGRLFLCIADRSLSVHRRQTEAASGHHFINIILKTSFCRHHPAGIILQLPS